MTPPKTFYCQKHGMWEGRDHCPACQREVEDQKKLRERDAEVDRLLNREIDDRTV